MPIQGIYQNHRNSALFGPRPTKTKNQTKKTNPPGVRTPVFPIAARVKPDFFSPAQTTHVSFIASPRKLCDKQRELCVTQNLPPSRVITTVVGKVQIVCHYKSVKNTQILTQNRLIFNSLVFLGRAKTVCCSIGRYHKKPHRPILPLWRPPEVGVKIPQNRAF